MNTAIHLVLLNTSDWLRIEESQCCRACITRAVRWEFSKLCLSRCTVTESRMRASPNTLVSKLVFRSWQRQIDNQGSFGSGKLRTSPRNISVLHLAVVQSTLRLLRSTPAQPISGRWLSPHVPSTLPQVHHWQSGNTENAFLACVHLIIHKPEGYSI